MPDKELINYIKQTRAESFSDDEIRKALLDSGWDGAEIDQAMRPGFFRHYKKILIISLAVIIGLPALAYGGLLLYQGLSQTETPAAGPAPDNQEQAGQQDDEPSEEELARKRDEQRLLDISRIEGALERYYASSQMYPETLIALAATSTQLVSVPTDPQTRAPYTYTALGSPPLHYSLAFMLETDFGTLSRGLVVVTSENQLQFENKRAEENAVQGLTGAPAGDLQITDLSRTSFRPGEEVLVEVSPGPEMTVDSVILTSHNLRLTDRTRPFRFSFSAPKTSGEYEINVFGFNQAGDTYSGSIRLTVE